MTQKNQMNEKGSKSSAGLKRETNKEERGVEHAKGSELKKGAKRVDERSRAANGKPADKTQK